MAALHELTFHEERTQKDSTLSMFIPCTRIRLLASCVAISVSLHLCALYATRLFASYDFGAAVGDPPGVVVELPGAAPAASATLPEASAPGKAEPAAERVAESGAVTENPPVPEASGAGEEIPAPPAPAAQAPAVAAAGPEPVASPVAQPVAARSAEAEAEDAAAPGAQHAAEAEPAVRPQTGAAEGDAPAGGRAVFSGKHEKLTYAVSMFGMPVGSAELEAKNDLGMTTLTLKIRSNAAAASIYPVSNFVETRHIDGKYLLTTIRQQEGNFRSDESFTINLQKKRVSLSDNIRYRNLKLTVPSAEVLDTLSGIYSLRSRPLQVGRTETLHIFDSEAYAEVPVEILRREEVRLPDTTTVAALVVRPLQKSAGIFRRTGDILIWMTDDAAKVPVRIVTTIALGKVTAELVSAEREEYGQREKVAGR